MGWRKPGKQEGVPAALGGVPGVPGQVPLLLAPHRPCAACCMPQLLAATSSLQGYQRPDLWDAEAYSHLCASGHGMPATWSLLPAAAGPPSGGAPANGLAAGAANGGAAEGASNGAAGDLRPAGQHEKGEQQQQEQQLWVHMPEASYRWDQVADCPVYVRCGWAAHLLLPS